jgi:hypothetical protein
MDNIEINNECYDHIWIIQKQISRYVIECKCKKCSKISEFALKD